MNYFRLIVGLLLLIESGCVTSHTTTGRYIDPIKVASIRDGVTTEADIFNWFGLCSVKGPKFPNGEELWLYQYIESDETATPGILGSPSFSNKQKSKTLTIQLKNGIVTSHKFEEGTTKSGPSLPL